MSDQLLDATRGLMQMAETTFPPGSLAHSEMAAARVRLDGPLMVAFAGKVKAGKSTLLNALVRERLAPTDAGECTRIVSMYQQGLTYGVTAHLRDGSERVLRFERTDEFLNTDLGGLAIDDVERLVVDWPSTSLEGMTLIDTPGIASLSADASMRAVQYLAPDDERATEADAVIYLMRHLHAADRKFLEAFHDQELSQASPVNTIAVLSRADEVGVGRLDAMASARRIAARYATDSQIRRLCQTVIPVAGLIAEAGATLRQDEYQAFVTLAHAPRGRTDALLVSVDRFSRSEDGCGLLPVEREHLLLRFGMYGARLCVALIRQGVVATAGDLSAELARRSGIDDLRAMLDTIFTERRSVLKARAGLLQLRSAIARFGDPGGTLAPDLERIWSNAHEIDELRLLNGIRSGQVEFDDELTTAIERAIGSVGSTPARRLGADGDTEPELLRGRALAVIGELRDAESHPLTTRDQVEALGVAIRSIEQVLGQIT